MTDASSALAAAHWGRSDLANTVLTALAAAGVDVDHLRVDDLALTDQFHGGGRPATVRLAELAGLDRPFMGDSPRQVLDVGGGLGGPARMLAATYGCHVTAVDLTESYVEAANELTRRVGLNDVVTHQVGNALDLPFEPGTFDMVWTQNSGMNIADKVELYRGFHRVLRPGGVLAFQEPLAGDVSPMHFPVMWADDQSLSFLLRSEELRSLVASVGFIEQTWQLTTTVGPEPEPLPPAHAVQRIIMGEAHLRRVMAMGRLNIQEGRSALVHAVFARA